MIAFFYNHKGIECFFGSLLHYEIFISYTFHILKVLNLENGKGMPSVPMFCKIMRVLHISSDEYVWPNQNRGNPTYQSLLNLLSQCGDYKLSVLHTTAEALLKDASDKGNDKIKK